jgi:hypothetical protein
MKRFRENLTTVVIFGISILGLGQAARAQQGPPASQQPMEIPAQYPPYPQSGPPPGGPQQAGPPSSDQQQGQNDAGAARLSFIHGDASTQHNNSTEWLPATLNTPLVNGDSISTGNGARVEIQLDHANVLRMSDQSTANLVNLSRSQMQIQIGQGLVNFDVLKGSDADVEIQTPNVAIHPQMAEGSFRIQVNSDGETIVDVRKGSAEISTPQGSTRVDRDQRITIQGDADNAQYQVSAPSSRDDWDKWNVDRDHVITSAGSWQHTNPYYTGSQDLDPYGQWNDVPDYGSVWFPSQDPGWAPYRDGRWVYEPYYGWTWVSYEPLGWAPYHYGRWFVYGGRWGWWPGPIYGGYRPIWAPAYVSFLGFGGAGWGVGIGFGSVGWLPCGPGDRFYPWYGRGVNRVNVVNVYNVHTNYGGFAPLRGGPGAFSNVDRASTDGRVRDGVSSMRADQFGRGRVPSQQARLDAGTFRQASMMTGANPVAPSRESFRPSDRAVGSSAIANRAATSQRFFTPRQGGATSFNRGVNPGSNGPAARPSMGNTQQQRGFTQPSSPSGSGWRSFTPSNQSRINGSPRTMEEQGAPQSRLNYSRPSEPSGQPQSYTRGSSSNPGYSGYSRPPLNMQQPVVTPRGATSAAPEVRTAPSGGYRGPASAPPSRGGSPGGGSRGGSSGGHSSSGHGHR